MTTQIEAYYFNSLLTFYNPTLSPLIFNNISLTFIKQEKQIIESRLSFRVNIELYHRIDTEALFNLKPEIRSPFKDEQFNADLDIHIETTLQPDLLPLLLENAQTPEEAATYLIKISQEFFNSPQTEVNPLLNTESWLALSVKQHQPSGEIGYTTFWNLLNPSTLSQPEITSDRLSETIVDFVKEWTETNLSEATEKATTEFLESISSVFRDLADETDLEPKFSENYSLFETVVNFFEEDEWPFIQKAEQTALFLSFRGNNGQWNCYTITKEESQQFIFYSLCPLSVPEEKRQVIAEFITRANYDMIIGNFELDFKSGDIRYKTSIDVEGFQLNSILIKPVVYHNVMTMDKYLPGILAILEDNLSPQQAITKIENL